MTPSPSETEALLALLDQERAAFLAQIARVPAGRQTERPAPDRWSAAEIAEHVARVDQGVGKLIALRTAEPVMATPDQLSNAAFTPDKVARVRTRIERIEAPERIRPTGTLDLQAALVKLANAREALKAAFRAAPAAVLDGAIHAHPVIGPLTLRGWVELSAHHDARHAEQVAELVDGWIAGKGSAHPA